MLTLVDKDDWSLESVACVNKTADHNETLISSQINRGIELDLNGDVIHCTFKTLRMAGSIKLSSQSVTTQSVQADTEFAFSYTAPPATFVSKFGNDGDDPDRIFYPIDIDVDASGNIYVLDAAQIRKYDDNENFLSAWSVHDPENGILNWRAAMTVDDEDNSYVLYREGGVLKFDAEGNYLLQWGGQGTVPAAFDSPNDIAVDSNKHVYVSDTGNNRIQKFDSDGNFLMMWGSQGIGNGEFHDPIGLAIDANDNLYVTDVKNSRIQKFDANGTYLDQWGSQGRSLGQLLTPLGIDIDPRDGSIYVSDVDAERVQKFDADGISQGYWGSFGAAASQFVRPQQLAVDRNGHIYVVDRGNDLNHIQKFSSTDSNTGSDIRVVSGQETTLAGLPPGGHSIQLEKPDGWRVERVDCDNFGYNQTMLDRGISLRLYGEDVKCIFIVEKLGNIALVNQTALPNDLPISFTYNLPPVEPPTYLTQWTTNQDVDSPYNYPRNGAIDTDGNFYVIDSHHYGSDYETLHIQKFDSNGTFLSAFGEHGTNDGEFEGPYDLAVTTDGFIYVADSQNNRIQKLDTNGNFILGWGKEGNDEGQFDRPIGVAVDNDGNVYVVDSDNYRIQKFDANGSYMSQWGSQGDGDGQFESVYGIAVDGSGYIYTTDQNLNRIQKFNANGDYLLRWGNEGSGNGQFDYPASIAADSNGYIYVADTRNYRVQKFDAEGNYLTRWGREGSLDGEFVYPQGIVADANRYIYVVDSWPNRIHRFEAMPSSIHIGNLSAGESRELTRLRPGRYTFTDITPDELVVANVTCDKDVKLMQIADGFAIEINGQETTCIFGENAVPDPTPTPNPEESPTPDPVESATPDPEDSATPDPEDSATPDPEDSATPEVEESATPEAEESPAPEVEDSATPEVEESATPATLDGQQKELDLFLPLISN